MYIKHVYANELNAKERLSLIECNEYFSWSSSMTESSFTNFNQYLLLKSKDDELIGYILFNAVGDFCELQLLYVRSSYRRQGLAAYLLDELLKLLDDNNLDRIVLEVRMSNIPARNFYKKYGFSKIYERKAYYSDPKESALVLEYKRRM